MSLGSWMRQVRKEKELTMQECADRAGVKQPVWAEWEAGVGERRRSTLRKIALGLGVPEQDVIEATDDGRRSDSEFGELLKGLTPHQKRVVLNVAKAARESLQTA